MIIQVDIHSKIEIGKLEDLHKLKLIMDKNNLKVNKSQIARELGVNLRTVGKYSNEYVSSTTRNLESKIDLFEPIIKELLSKDSIQIFYYKRILLQYLKDNHELDCAQSSFRRYISNHPEFNQYFGSRKKSHLSKTTPTRYETDKAKQAQLDWKENIEFILSTGEVININIFMLILSYLRFRVYKLSLHKTQNILFCFLDKSFKSFCGVPKELLKDNMKTVMDEPRTNYSKGKINNKFQQFAKDYGFKVHPCVADRLTPKLK